MLEESQGFCLGTLFNGMSETPTHHSTWWREVTARYFLQFPFSELSVLKRNIFVLNGIIWIKMIILNKNLHFISI